MTLKEALTILGIEKYGKRIFNSNSHGELFHLYQYYVFATTIGKTQWFPKWFELIVKEAEDNWERPESVFQYIDKLILQIKQ